jgi:hypothetical protein
MLHGYGEYILIFAINRKPDTCPIVATKSGDLEMLHTAHVLFLSRTAIAFVLHNIYTINTSYRTSFF